MKNLIFLIGVTLLLAGCATTYSKEGLFSGGYDEMKIQDNIFRVSFRGNAYTSSQRAEDFGLLRCAEVTIENGYNYFAIIKEEATVKTSTYTTPAQAETHGAVYGNTYSTKTYYSGGETYTYHKPRVGIMIECFKEKPENLQGIVYDAEQVKTNIKSKYEIK